MRARHWILACLLPLVGAGAGASAGEPVQVRIDAGGVNVELVDAPLEPPVQLTYRAQGSCQPEVNIVATDKLIEAEHTKSCHGSGDHEGTIFTLKVNAHTSLDLQLTAGGVTIAPAGLENYRQIRLESTVGGIATLPASLGMTRQRRWLVGGTAQRDGEAGCCTLSVHVNYGGISIQ